MITRKPEACGRASKRRSLKSASGPFLPTWQMRNAALPIILTISNHERLHSSIDYQTPYLAHQQIFHLNALNCPA